MTANNVVDFSQAKEKLEEKRLTNDEELTEEEQAELSEDQSAAAEGAFGLYHALKAGGHINADDKSDVELTQYAMLFYTSIMTVIAASKGMNYAHVNRDEEGSDGETMDLHGFMEYIEIPSYEAFVAALDEYGTAMKQMDADNDDGEDE